MNDTVVKEMYQRNPLLAFSIHTCGQAAYIVELGEKLIEEMQSWEHGISNFHDVYYRYWLWVLGAYEIVRHMSEKKHEKCFSEQLQKKIVELKPYLAEMRIPFAKQELRGIGSRASKELLVHGTNKDMGFEIKGVIYSAIHSIEKFRLFVSEIELSDILKSS